jgi:aminoethylphosphonate catabolism LysR family transcriptional regulator
MRHAQLRAFHHVALTGGFSRAAEALHLSQPAVSDQVSRLERTHDVLLFHRDARRIRLTEDGARLFDLTKQFFDVEDRIAATLTESRSAVRGQLRLAVDAAHHVTGVLARFRAAHPGVTVTLKTGNTAWVLDELRNYTADVGVIGARAEGRIFDAVPLGQSRIIAFASRTLAQALPAALHFADLDQLPLVFRESGSKTRQHLEQEAARRGIRLKPAFVADGREAVRDLVIAGIGVGFISQAEFRADAALTALPFADARITMSETLVCLAQRRDVRVIRAFMDAAMPDEA